MTISRTSFVFVTLCLQTLLASDATAQVIHRGYTGRLTPDQVRAMVSQWQVSASTEPRWSEIVPEFKRLGRGATVRVFLGMWCADSMYELPKFIRLVDALADSVPFNVEFIAVDEQKQQPRREVQSHGISYLPTFVVLRNGREVGRIVEHPPRALEQDLLRLLNGTATGLLTSNESAILQYLSAHSQ